MEFSIFDSVFFLSKFKFCSNKIMDSLTWKLHNSFQIKITEKPHTLFPDLWFLSFDCGILVWLLEYVILFDFKCCEIPTMCAFACSEWTWETAAWCEIGTGLTMMTTEQFQWCRSGVWFVGFGPILRSLLVFLLLVLSV